MAITNLLIGALAVVCTATLAYWVSDDDPPVTDYKAAVVPPLPRPGEVMHVRHELIRQRQCHLRLQQIVYDKDRLRYTAPIQEYIIAPGELGPDHFVTSIALPKDMKPGPARYRAIRAYYCNPIHWAFDWPIMVVGRDVTFDISD